MTPDQQLDADTRRSFQGLAWTLVVLLLAVFAWCATAFAQTIDRPTRITPYDFQCQDANGNKISDHQQQGIAIVECYNNAAGAFVQGGRYRINRSTAPPVEPPACPAKPADDTRTATCPSGTTGSWQQTQSYGSVAYPTCWVPSGYIPSAAPAGACVAIPPPQLPAPAGISATVSPNTTNPGNHNVALSWLAVTGATGYAIERCTGATCTNFAALGTTTNTAYTNANVPGGLTYRYRIAGTPNGAWSAIRNVTTPTATTPPPPTSAGTARMSWDTPPTDTDGNPTVIAGYRFLYSIVLPGGAGPSLNQTLNLGAVNAHEFTGLTSGRWAFTIIAIDTQGRTSQQSNLAYRDVP